MNDAAKQILTAVAAATAATLVTGLLTHYLTKQATIENIAKGTEPLPPGATPKTGNVDAQGSTPSPTPPAPPPTNTQLAAMAQAAGDANVGWVQAAWQSLGYGK
jgi:hypothetical protein